MECSFHIWLARNNRVCSSKEIDTCYANAILQVLSVLPSLWNRVPSESSSLTFNFTFKISYSEHENKTGI